MTTIGGTTANASADSTGNINLIDAALKKGVKKFVLVTSVGCGSSKDAPGEKARCGPLKGCLALVSICLALHTVARL